ncbi:MAG: hypothetical protein ACI4JX_06190, partial [Oscillospiraceae bacterium]
GGTPTTDTDSSTDTTTDTDTSGGGSSYPVIDSSPYVIYPDDFDGGDRSTKYETSDGSVVITPESGYSQFIYLTQSQTATYKFNIPADGKYTVTARVASNSKTLNWNISGSDSASGSFKSSTTWTDYKLISDKTLKAGDYTLALSTSASDYKVCIQTVTVTSGSVPSASSYTFAATAGTGGSITGTASGTYTEGTSISVTATPSANYEFVNWTNASGTEVSKSATYSFVIKENTSLKANFKLITKKTVAVTFDSAQGSVTIGGSTAASGVTKSYDEGSSVTVSATAKTGYFFTGWLDESSNVVSSDSSYTFTLNSDVVLTASFASKIRVEAESGEYNSGCKTDTNYDSTIYAKSPSDNAQLVRFTSGDGKLVIPIDIPTAGTYNFEARIVAKSAKSIKVRIYPESQRNGFEYTGTPLFTTDSLTTAIMNSDESSELVKFSATFSSAGKYYIRISPGADNIYNFIADYVEYGM